MKILGMVNEFSSVCFFQEAIRQHKQPKPCCFVGGGAWDGLYVCRHTSFLIGLDSTQIPKWIARLYAIDCEKSKEKKNDNKKASPWLQINKYWLQKNLPFLKTKADTDYCSSIITNYTLHCTFFVVGTLCSTNTTHNSFTRQCSSLR